MRKTTIQIDIEIKKRLDQLKVHPREPYNDVIKRLLDHYQSSKSSYNRKKVFI